MRPASIDERYRDLREEVRAFVAEERASGRLDAFGLGLRGHSPEFSRRLAAKGWVGMTLPKHYGGRDASALERFAVTEELLGLGAPVAAHWVADRQTGPSLLLFGSDEQRDRFLPMIARGECSFSIGMSEPDAGSDLAAVRTAARQVEGGWSINGTKIWTTFAHRNDFFIVLCRTSPAADRHEGLSQLIVDLHAPGVTVRPIETLDGASEFNEVVLQDVFVADNMVLGELGSGWRQVTSELGYERSGPERYLSSFYLFDLFVRGLDADSASSRDIATIGHLVTQYWILRELSMGVAGMLDDGKAPILEAALVKDIGTTFEQEVVREVVRMWGKEIDVPSDSPLEREIATSILMSPAYTIQGGTTEVLRSIITRRMRP